MHFVKEPRGSSFARAGAPMGTGGERPPTASVDSPPTLAGARRFFGRPIGDTAWDAATIATLPAYAMDADATRQRPRCGDALKRRRPAPGGARLRALVNRCDTRPRGS
jgi:hypothetical protein